MRYIYIYAISMMEYLDKILSIVKIKYNKLNDWWLTVSGEPSCWTGFQSVLQSILYITRYLVVHCLQHPSRPCVVIPLTKLALGSSTYNKVFTGKSNYCNNKSDDNKMKNNKSIIILSLIVLIYIYIHYGICILIYETGAMVVVIIW